QATPDDLPDHPAGDPGWGTRVGRDPGGGRDRVRAPGDRGGRGGDRGPVRRRPERPAAGGDVLDDRAGRPGAGRRPQSGGMMPERAAVVDRPWPGGYHPGMHLLFLHQNFPAQFGPVASRLAGRPGYRCTFLHRTGDGSIPGVEQVRFGTAGGATARTHFYSRTFENVTWQSYAAYAALKARPDLR